MTTEEYNRKVNLINKFSKQCVCGRKVFIGNKRQWNICTWCGRKVKNDTLEFKENLLMKMEAQNGKVNL